MVKLQWKTVGLAALVFYASWLISIPLLAVSGKFATFYSLLWPCLLGYVCTYFPPEHSYWNLLSVAIILFISLMLFLFILPFFLMIVLGPGDYSPGTNGHTAAFPGSGVVQLCLYVLGGYIGKLRALASS